MRTLKEIERAYYTGDHLEDVEMETLQCSLEKVVCVLQHLGPRWHFAWNEARRISDELSTFIKNRKRHDEMFGPPGTSEKKLKKCGHLKTYDCNGAMCEALNGIPFNRRFR